VFVTRTVGWLVCFGAALLGWLVSVDVQPADASGSLTLAIAGSRIYFVPLGDFQNDQLEPLAQYYRKKYHLGITILPAVPVDPSTRDTSRRQLMAENIVSGLRSQVPKYAYDQKAILIAFTSEDIYPTSRDW
jgi:hypothetical protein